MKTSKQRREQRKRAKLRNMIEKRTANKCPMPVEGISFPQVKCGHIAPEFHAFDLNLFANLAQVACAPTCKNEKQENTMNTSINPEKNYLGRRADNVEYHVELSLPKKFGLVDDSRPRTPNDLIARITAGKYIVSKDRAEYNTYDPLDYIRWRDPATVEDQAGFDAAKTKLKADAQALRDTIVVKDLDTGLAALQAFETANLPAN